jgi:hypothetical protein
MNVLKISKPAAILLAVALEIGILLAGQAQAQTVVQPSPISADILAPLSASGSLYSTTPAMNRLPTIWDITIFDFVYGYAAQVYWMRPNQNQKQINTLFRSGHGGTLNGSRGGEVTSPGTHPAADISSLSLHSLSPPGLILRL